MNLYQNLPLIRSQTYKLFFILLLVFTSFISSGQDLRVGEFKNLPNDISARENTVTDVNLEACALIKVRTGLNDVRFFSNLSVEKVEQHSGEYWVWVSPGTSNIKIAVNDFPLVDFTLPEAVDEFDVCAVLLIATFPDRIIYRDTTGLQPFVSFISDPSDAEVYINDNYYGQTPLKANIADSIITYSITKKHYKRLEENDTLDNTISTITSTLERDYRSKMYFASLGAGLNTYFGNNRNSDNNQRVNLPVGLSIGRIGGAGFYVSASFATQYIKPDLAYITEDRVQIPLNSVAGYSYSDPRDYYVSPQTVLQVKDRFNLFRVSAGATLQMTKNSFLLIGAGYSQRSYYKVFIKEPYDLVLVEGTEPESTSAVYGIILDESYRGFNLDAGLIVRLKNHYMISLNVTPNFRLSSFADTPEYDALSISAASLTLGRLFTDIKIGFGYAF